MPAKKAAPKPAPHNDGDVESRARPMSTPTPPVDPPTAEELEAAGAAEAAAEQAAEAPTDEELEARLAVSQVDPPGAFDEMDEPDDTEVADAVTKAWAAKAAAAAHAELEAEEADAEVVRTPTTEAELDLAAPPVHIEGSGPVLNPVSGTLRGLSPLSLVLYVVDGVDRAAVATPPGRAATIPGDVLPAVVVAAYDNGGRGDLRVLGLVPECDFAVRNVALIETPERDEIGGAHMGRCYWPPKS